jgi:superfamily II DNA or RNA helicase
MSGFTHYHSQYLAHRITLAGVGDDAFAQSLSTARVDMNPHQVDAALFALQPPVPRGAILADEVGLGKTIEAGLVVAQKWAERKRRILLVVPASLRKQWTQELFDKFSLPATILEAKSHRDHLKQGRHRPFEVENNVVVTSYEFAARKADELAMTTWDLVVFDEAHRLRNVYRDGGSARAKALRGALKERFKILLTATPLQNSLMELFGLVSVIDPLVFGDEASFRINYGGKRPDAASLLMLRDRLKPVSRRSLRRDVQAAGHIRYTNRIPATFSFEPHDDEVRLYEGLSAYLKRKDTIAFGAKPNQLVTMSVRKILGSSSFAVAQTLDSIVERLNKLRPPTLEDLPDIETGQDTEEWKPADAPDGDPPLDAEEQVDPLKLQAEIEELTGWRDLAHRIRVNAKGERLIAALPGLLDQIEAKGGARKVVIFTESVRTQNYLAALLSEAGHAGQIALMNGSNADPESKAIHADWLARHRGTDAVSGSRTADMKAAIVEAFRDHRTILIATESGAEGINLQFCSLLVNFDLPWNPQRVEQRIGRCHRYGQKIDVMVVNLLNLRNRAEERVYELLNTKFLLFEGVFGASDEVLGAIESGIDFERRVFEIQQSARTDAEIDAAFDVLQKELEETIRADMADARGRLLESVDQDVVRRLKNRAGEIKRVLGDFEQRLTTIARAELPDHRFFDHTDGSPCFEHEGETWTTGWPLADQQGWRFFRLADGNLARQLVDRAKARSLSPSTLRFSYGTQPQGQLSDVRLLVGQSGWLRIAKLAVGTAERPVEHLLVSAVTDEGTPLDAATADRLFLVPAECIVDSTPPSPGEALDRREDGLKAEKIAEAEAANSAFLLAETDKLDAYADDLEKAADAEIKQLDDEIRARKRAMRANPTLTLSEKVEEQRAIKRLEAKRDDAMLAKFERRKAIRKEVDDILDRVQTSLKISPELVLIFTTRWEVRP